MGLGSNPGIYIMLLPVDQPCYFSFQIKMSVGVYAKDKNTNASIMATNYGGRFFNWENIELDQG